MESNDQKFGIYIIKNKKTNRRLLGCKPVASISGNLEKQLHLLRGKKHAVKKLQEDWNKYGEDSFVFDIFKIYDSEKMAFRSLDMMFSHEAKKSWNLYNYSSKWKQKMDGEKKAKSTARKSRKKVEEETVEADSMLQFFSLMFDSQKKEDFTSNP
jgi:hypothetical protein